MRPVPGDVRRRPYGLTVAPGRLVALRRLPAEAAAWARRASLIGIHKEGKRPRDEVLEAIDALLSVLSEGSRRNQAVTRWAQTVDGAYIAYQSIGEGSTALERRSRCTQHALKPFAEQLFVLVVRGRDGEVPVVGDELVRVPHQLREQLGGRAGHPDRQAAEEPLREPGHQGRLDQLGLVAGFAARAIAAEDVHRLRRQADVADHWNAAPSQEFDGRRHRLPAL